MLAAGLGAGDSAIVIVVVQLRRMSAAEKAVAEAARLIGVEEISHEEQIEALRSWQGDRNAELEKAGGALEEWEELQRLLGQSSLDELAGEVERLLAEARALADEVDIEDTAELPLH